MLFWDQPWRNKNLGAGWKSAKKCEHPTPPRSCLMFLYYVFCPHLSYAVGWRLKGTQSEEILHLLSTENTPIAVRFSWFTVFFFFFFFFFFCSIDFLCVLLFLYFLSKSDNIRLGRNFLGHFKRHFRSYVNIRIIQTCSCLANESHTGNKKSVLSYLCLSVCTCPIVVWPRSSFT